MNVARASWIAVVAICFVTALIFAINGYTGYMFTLLAVGLAAAVNL